MALHWDFHSLVVLSIGPSSGGVTCVDMIPPRSCSRDILGSCSPDSPLAPVPLVPLVSFMLTQCLTQQPLVPSRPLKGPGPPQDPCPPSVLFSPGGRSALWSPLPPGLPSAPAVPCPLLSPCSPWTPGLTLEVGPVVDGTDERRPDEQREQRGAGVLPHLSEGRGAPVGKNNMAYCLISGTAERRSCGEEQHGVLPHLSEGRGAPVGKNSTAYCLISGTGRRLSCGEEQHGVLPHLRDGAATLLRGRTARRTASSQRGAWRSCGEQQGTFHTITSWDSLQVGTPPPPLTTKLTLKFSSAKHLFPHAAPWAVCTTKVLASLAPESFTFIPTGQVFTL